MTDYPGDVTVEEEIATLTMGRPHVLLLGAGASKAALPEGDKHGKSPPLMRDVAEELGLDALFPKICGTLESATLKLPTLNWLSGPILVSLNSVNYLLTTLAGSACPTPRPFTTI